MTLFTTQTRNESDIDVFTKKRNSSLEDIPLLHNDLMQNIDRTSIQMLSNPMFNEITDEGDDSNGRIDLPSIDIPKLKN